MAKQAVGTIGWVDLTVESAVEVRDFYQEVVGWTSEPVEMGGYDDFQMRVPNGGEVVAGVCHARGANTGLPTQWLIYITVADAERSAKCCVARGGTILLAPRSIGDGLFCVIQDPAGAVCALYQSESPLKLER
jgi:predicted enzyme related to lactoylglutathione lyase